MMPAMTAFAEEESEQTYKELYYNIADGKVYEGTTGSEDGYVKIVMKDINRKTETVDYGRFFIKTINVELYDYDGGWKARSNQDGLTYSWTDEPDNPAATPISTSQTIVYRATQNVMLECSVFYNGEELKSTNKFKSFLGYQFNILTNVVKDASLCAPQYAVRGNDCVLTANVKFANGIDRKASDLQIAVDWYEYYPDKVEPGKPAKGFKLVSKSTYKDCYRCEGNSLIIDADRYQDEGINELYFACQVNVWDNNHIYDDYGSNPIIEKIEIVDHQPTPTPDPEPVIEKTPVEIVQANTVGNAAIKLSWNKVEDASKYVVYGAKCGKTMKKLASTSKVTYTVKKLAGKKLVPHKTYKFYVVAYTDKGKIKSKTIHYIAANTSGKYANAKSIHVSEKSITMGVNESSEIAAKCKMPKNKKHLPKAHGATIRYTSDCPQVVSVDKNGKLKANQKGSATIYVQDAGGKYCTVDVTVK